jgi:N-acetylmuramoyl-L-alanine amidase
MSKLRKFLVSTLIVTTISTSLPGFVYSSPQVVYAGEEELQGYVNPHDIVIATPANKYTTSASKVSILGACDYEYPLYLNGQPVETTEYGFFTKYVELSVGENYFTFQNNGKTKTLTIIRKKPASTSGNTSGNNSGTPSGTSNASSYKAYTTDTYGVITGKYTMPRSTVSDSDLYCMPLTRGTTVRLLGEQKGYYKIADGTFVDKSSVTKYNKAIGNNIVSNTKMTNKMDTNQIVTELTMNINTLYEVYFEGQEVYLTLYETTSAKNIVVPPNELVKEVTKVVDVDEKKVIYGFEFYDDALVLGYDVLFNNGVMKFELKKAPRLEEKGSLTGTTIFLDAGHGADDSGAVGPLGKLGPREKDTNLNITLYAKEYLEDLGAKVVLSRDQDIFYSLSDRVSMIRNLRPDLSVSIHGNSLDYSTDYLSTNGFLTYYSYTLNADVPTLMNNSIANTLGFTVREPRQKSLSLTRLTTCPSVLLETAFLCNPSDYEFLLKTENQKAYGAAIGKAIQEYFESIADYGSITYIVKKGDTLKKIAISFGVTVEDILESNQITDINNIVIGQKLEIPQ